jgi:hypothetical protein
VAPGVHLPKADATPEAIRTAIDGFEPIDHRRDEVRATGGASHAADAVEALCVSR